MPRFSGSEARAGLRPAPELRTTNAGIRNDDRKRGRKQKKQKTQKTQKTQIGTDKADKADKTDKPEKRSKRERAETKTWRKRRFLPKKRRGSCRKRRLGEKIRRKERRTTDGTDCAGDCGHARIHGKDTGRRRPVRPARRRRGRRLAVRFVHDFETGRKARSVRSRQPRRPVVSE